MQEYNKALEWAAKWIEDSLSAESNERTIEFGKNMAMTFRAHRKPWTAPQPAPDAEGEKDAVADECQRRVDTVAEAAVEWHQSGQEGDDSWFEKSEVLSRAIESLLELRSPADMPRRWCKVHKKIEFKYESLEHELATTECFCGTQLEAGLCPKVSSLRRDQWLRTLY